MSGAELVAIGSIASAGAQTAGALSNKGQSQVIKPSDGSGGGSTLQQGSYGAMPAATPTPISVTGGNAGGSIQQPAAPTPDLLSTVRNIAMSNPAQAPQPQQSAFQVADVKPGGSSVKAEAPPARQAAQAPTPQTPASAAAPAAAAAKGSSTILGLDGNQWGAIGTASGILANLFQKSQQPAPVLNPTSPTPQFDTTPLGANLGAAAPRVSGLSQFAINNPSTSVQGVGSSQSELLKKLGLA